jgi:hypothetical protein
MAFITWLAILFIIICIPPILLILFIYYLSGNYNFTFKVTGYLKFKDIHLTLETENMHLDVHVDIFQIYIIWLRLRVYIKGVKCTYKLKGKDLPFLRKDISKSDFIDMFVIKKKEKSNNYQLDLLEELKNKFFKILKEKYIDKHSEENQPVREEYGVDSISFLKPAETTRNEKILRNLLSLIDLLIENVDVNFGLTNLNFYHKVTNRKMILGSIKGINKVKIFIKLA